MGTKKLEEELQIYQFTLSRCRSDRCGVGETVGVAVGETKQLEGNKGLVAVVHGARLFLATFRSTQFSCNVELLTQSLLSSSLLVASLEPDQVKLAPPPTVSFNCCLIVEPAPAGY